MLIQCFRQCVTQSSDGCWSSEYTDSCFIGYVVFVAKTRYISILNVWITSGLHLQYVHKVDLEGGNHHSSMLRCYVQMLHALEVNVVHQLVWSVFLSLFSLLRYPTDISPILSSLLRGGLIHRWLSGGLLCMLNLTVRSRRLSQGLHSQHGKHTLTGRFDQAVEHISDNYLRHYH